MTARAAYRADIKARADKDFAAHRLTVEQGDGPARMFRCARPGTGIYSFRVVFGPGFVVVTGDIGDRILNCSDRDTLAWARGSRLDLDYVCGKMTEKPREFIGGMADEYLEQLAAEGYADLAARVRGLWRDDDSADAWLSACYEANVDDPPPCTDHEFESQWIAHALRRFCELYEATQQPEATTA